MDFARVRELNDGLFVTRQNTSGLRRSSSFSIVMFRTIVRVACATTPVCLDSNAMTSFTFTDNQFDPDLCHQPLERAISPGALSRGGRAASRRISSTRARHSPDASAVIASKINPMREPQNAADGVMTIGRRKHNYWPFLLWKRIQDTEATRAPASRCLKTQRPAWRLNGIKRGCPSPLHHRPIFNSTRMLAEKARQPRRASRSFIDDKGRSFTMHPTILRQCQYRSGSGICLSNVASVRASVPVRWRRRSPIRDIAIAGTRSGTDTASDGRGAFVKLRALSSMTSVRLGGG